MAGTDATGAARSLVLASRSPRRLALLRAAGLDCTVAVPDIDEEAHQFGPPAEQVLATARAKATAVAGRLEPGTLLLAADTTVALAAEALNKPADAAEARAMLRRLSGCVHTVHTGIVLERVGGVSLAAADRAEVRFHALDEAIIEAYVASGEPFDKAGGYGVQRMGAWLVADVDGDVTCVAGLPLRRLAGLYRTMTGAELLDGRRLRDVALVAFPDLARLPEACLAGLDD